LPEEDQVVQVEADLEEGLSSYLLAALVQDLALLVEVMHPLEVVKLEVEVFLCTDLDPSLEEALKEDNPLVDLLVPKKVALALSEEKKINFKSTSKREILLS
jgi:hypothetical protein